MTKLLGLFILLTLVASSLVMVEYSFAQSVFTPSVPVFTVTLADHSYDVPTTTTSTINPYNNQTATTTIPGYHIQNMTIDLTIKNQPFPSSIEGNKSYLLFYVRMKGHFGEDWIYPYGDAINSYPVQSDSEYTVLSFPPSYRTTTPYGEKTEYMQPGDEIDFQVKAILAYGYNYSLSAVIPVYSYDYEGVAGSDWSNTQTFTMPASSSSTLPSPTESVPNMGPTSPPNSISADLAVTLVLIAIAVLVIFVVSLLLYVRHLKENSKPA
jgi:hypothetical protein